MAQRLGLFSSQIIFLMRLAGYDEHVKRVEQSGNLSNPAWKEAFYIRHSANDQLAFYFPE